MQCVSGRMSTENFIKGQYQKVRTQATRSAYYNKFGQSIFGLGMPGLGYDCFRNWELLTMGSMVVTERGVGYDRTVSHMY